MRCRAHVSAITVGALLAAAPTSTEPVVPVTTDAESDARPPTPWSEALGAFDPEGSGDVNAALAMLNLALGPIEGLPPPPADTGAQGDITVAYRAVLGVWDELSDEQRAGVEAVLFPQEAVTAAVGFSGPTAADTAQPLADTIARLARQVRDAIAGRIGDFERGLTVRVARRNNAANDLGIAVVRPDASGTFSGNCAITIFPSATTVASDTSEEIDVAAHRLLNTIAHEVFHCFQYDGYRTPNAFAAGPSWVIEGGAEWVAATLIGADDTTPDRWYDYLTQPSRPLPHRSYDALGFWTHLEESSVDPWTVFRDVWSVAGTAASFERAGANTDAFLDTWASGFFRDPARGAAWDTTGPGITTDAAVPKALDVAPGATMQARSAPFANELFVLFSTAEVVEIIANGRARLSDGTIDTTELASSRHCRRAGGCACPNDPDDVPLLMLEDGALLALTGGVEGSMVTVNGLSLDEHCDREIPDDPTRTITPWCPAPGAVGDAAGYSVPDPSVLEHNGVTELLCLYGTEDAFHTHEVVSVGFFVAGEGWLPDEQCVDAPPTPTDVAGASEAVSCPLDLGDRTIFIFAHSEAGAIRVTELVIAGG